MAPDRHLEGQWKMKNESSPLPPSVILSQPLRSGSPEADPMHDAIADPLCLFYTISEAILYLDDQDFMKSTYMNILLNSSALILPDEGLSTSAHGAIHARTLPYEFASSTQFLGSICMDNLRCQYCQCTDYQRQERRVFRFEV